MEDIDVDKPHESSISNAVDELLSMTNAAVKKLTEPRTVDSDSTISSVEQKSDDGSTAGPAGNNDDRRLLEILSETRESTRNEVVNEEDNNDENVAIDEQVYAGKVIDVTNVLAESSKSEISILDVGGGHIDSSMSTPTSGHQHVAESQFEKVSKTFPRTIPTPSMFKDSISPERNADTILSPIVLETDAGHMEEEAEHSFQLSMRKAHAKDNLTSSVKSSSNSDRMSTSRGSSTASEVLKQSTRAPRIPESARVKSPRVKSPKRQPTEKPTKTSAMTDFDQQNEVIVVNQPRSVIMKKSKHALEKDANGSSQPEKAESSHHKIRISKKRMQEIQRPIVGNSPSTDAKMSKAQRMQDESVPLVRTTLSQGVIKVDDDKENEGIDTRIDRDLKIIRSDIGATKKKLLGSIKTGDQYKRMVPANIVNEKTMQKRMVQGQPSDIMTIAMQHTAPMLKVQQDLESQVTRLTDKLNELERQKQQEQSLKHQERSVDLERRLDELTAMRLKSIEQLQEQQAAWQTQFLKVVGSMQSTQNKLNDAAAGAEHLQSRTVRFDGVKGSHDVLRTPAPRTQAPHPMPNKEKAKGTSPGNAYLLKNILEQMDVSTPGPSPAVVPPNKIIRDPLAEVTPVRGPTQKTEPYGVKFTSTPHLDDDDRAAVIRAKKSAREEAERIEIMKQFPSSVSDYMIQEPAIKQGLNPVAPERILKPVEEKPIDDIWMELKDLQTRRKILDENLAIVERGRGGEDIAAAVEYDILSTHPEINPTKAEELRLKKMVDDQIKLLKEEPTRDTIYGQAARAGFQKSERSKVIGKKGRMPAALQGAKVNTGLLKNQRNGRMDRRPAGKTASQRTRSHSPSVGAAADIVGPDTEDFVTHVYGRAVYHPRRTTVHNPYLHLKSPLKKPTFRKKKAVEVVKASMVKSARTQTSPPHGSPAQYYFTPSTSPARPPISTSPTPGQLIPMAIPLGPPVISDAPKPTPVIIHQTDAAYTTFVVDTPEPKKTIRIYNPADASHSRKPNTAVISVKGEDGPDLSIQKMENIDIDTPDVSETTNVRDIYSPVKDAIPGSTPLLKHDKDESEGSDRSLHIELRGAANGGVPLDYHGPSFPPKCPPHRQLNASDIADEIDKHELEQETVRWVEQEILARILSELYPPGSQKIKDSGPVDESQHDETTRSNPGVLNPESLQLFVDAGLPIDDATINRLVEDELTQILREMIKRPAQDQTTRPKTPIAKPKPSTRQTQHHTVPTPLPTPEPSPRTSVSEKVHLHTPSLTPESSMAESISAKDPTPATSPQPQMQSPKVESLPKTPENVTLVETPGVTPPSTPTPVPARPRTPVLSMSAKSPPSSPKRKLPDPWGDVQFPLPEEIHKPKASTVSAFAPPPAAVDLVVRTVTPPPATPPDRSLSEGETTPTVSSDRGESSISEGQLLISHGEVRAKMKRGQLPGIIEDIFGEDDVRKSMGLHSTLKDVKDLEDFEQRSEGEIRLSMRPAMISRVIGHSRAAVSPPGDDPAGVYSHPRHPLPSETDDDLSVGEVKQETIVNRRSKFKKWREERSPKYSSRTRNENVRPELSASRDSPLSMDDLQGKERQTAFEYSGDDSARTSIASDIEESFGAKLIMVEPASKKTEKAQEEPTRNQFSVQPKDTLVSTDFQKTLASTDHSGVIKDSLEDSANRRDFYDQAIDKNAQSSHHPAMKVSLTLPTADQAASVSSEAVSDVSEISGAGF